MKHNSYIVKRNRSICNLFWTLYRAGTPTMRAYAELADKFDLAERSIREIVQNRSSWFNEKNNSLVAKRP